MAARIAATKLKVPKKAAAPAVTAPVVTVEPAAAAVATTVVPVAPVATVVAKKPRVQLSTVLNINISQARCATHLKQNLGDVDIEREIKTLRATMKVSKAAGGDVTELKAQITEKSKALVRISSETPIAAAVIWDGAVKEILIHGMDQAIVCDRKIVDTVHLHEGSPESLVYYPLYSKCDVWSSYDPTYEAELKKDRAKENKELRDAKKDGVKTTKVVAKAVEVSEDEPEDDDHTTKTTFYTYVENALKTVKKNELYKSMRVSNRVREYLSELVAQGIARQAMLARIIVQQVMGVRTMNAGHVKAVVNVLMADEGRTSEQIEHVTSQIDEKLCVYSEHLKVEKDKKAAALDDDTKIENEYKRSESDLNRKKKQAEIATKRASDAAQKAKTLFDEASTLEPIVAANKAKIVVKVEEPTEPPTVS